MLIICKLNDSFLKAKSDIWNVKYFRVEKEIEMSEKYADMHASKQTDRERQAEASKRGGESRQRHMHITNKVCNNFDYLSSKHLYYKSFKQNSVCSGVSFSV